MKRRLTNKACTILRYINLTLDSSLMFIQFSFYRKWFLWTKTKWCLCLIQQTQLVCASLKSLELLIILTLVLMGSTRWSTRNTSDLFPSLLHLYLYTEVLDHTISIILPFPKCIIALGLPSGPLTLSTRSLHQCSWVHSWISSFAERIVILGIGKKEVQRQ